MITVTAELPPALDWGYSLGTVLREPNMRVSAWLYAPDGTALEVISAGSLPELRGAAHQAIGRIDDLAA